MHNTHIIAWLNNINNFIIFWISHFYLYQYVFLMKRIIEFFKGNFKVGHIWMRNFHYHKF